MFDIGWTEMLVVACVAIIVVGPKDLPKMLRTFGKAMKSVRGLASDFQKQFDEAVKEADLADVKDIATGKKFSPLEDIKKSVTDFEKDVKQQMDAKAGDAGTREHSGLPQPVAEKLGIETESTKTAAASKKTGTGKASAKKTAQTKASAKKTTAKKPAAVKAGSAKPAATASRKTAAKTTTKSTAAKATKRTPSKASTAKAAKRA